MESLVGKWVVITFGSYHQRLKRIECLYVIEEKNKIVKVKESDTETRFLAEIRTINKDQIVQIISEDQVDVIRNHARDTINKYRELQNKLLKEYRDEMDNFPGKYKPKARKNGKD